MATQLNPYLSFKSNAKEAMEFYQSVFGGELNAQTFKEFGASKDPSEDNLVMHAELKSPNGLVLMASDTPARMEFKPGNNVSLSLNGDDDERLSEYFAKLSEGGSVTMPLEKAMWGDKFGMLRDKFGINWFVNISGGDSANA